jgi:hypothetical protein
MPCTLDDEAMAGFHRLGYPNSCFLGKKHGTSENPNQNMDDVMILGYPHDLGNLHIQALFIARVFQ